MPNPFKILDFITIRNKNEISINNGTEKALDMSEGVVEDKIQLRYSSAPVIITEELAGKPTSISKIKYDDGSFGDLLCHYNGISNPLMIPEGYIFFTPELDSMVLNVVDKNNDKSKNKSKENLNKKLSKKDKNRVQSLINRSKAAATTVGDDIATPNMSDENIPDIVAVNGEVILGNNVTNTRCSQELSATQTRSESIKKAIKDEIAAR